MSVKKNISSIIVLICINVMDSVMGAVVGPTLIFYVIELGGTKEHYGMMQSVSALGMMLTIPIYGNWVDWNGNKYRVPYLCSFALGIMSYLVYFLAVLLPKGPIAIYSVIFSRFLSGAAGSSRTLAYSWVASSIPQEQQRTIITFLSMSKTFGMVVGPLTNYLVSEIDTKLKFFGCTIPLDPNNSIGLLMVGSELILAVLTIFLLEEPPTKENKVKKLADSSVASTNEKDSKGFWRALYTFDVLYPIFTMFILACNFTLLGTAFSPVARNLGWSAVEISEVSAIGSVVLVVGLVISMIVSMTNISDFSMISFGFANFLVGGGLMYAWWIEGVGTLQFTVPMYALFFAYPFIGPANRSRYIMAIHNSDELEGSNGLLMSFINQAAAIALFVSPTIVASTILRDPKEIKGSADKHQLGVGALYVPIFSALVLVGLSYQEFFLGSERKRQSIDGSVSETSSLLSPTEKKVPRASLLRISDELSRTSEVYRRLSVEIMSIPNPVETKYEQELTKQLLKDKEDWEDIDTIVSSEE